MAQPGLGPRTTSSTFARRASRKVSVVPRLPAGPRIEKRVRVTRGRAAGRAGEGPYESADRVPAGDPTGLPAEAGPAACTGRPGDRPAANGTDAPGLEGGGTLGTVGMTTGGGGVRGAAGGVCGTGSAGGTGGTGGAAGTGGNGGTGGAFGTVGVVTVGTVTGKVGVVGSVGKRSPWAPSPKASAEARPIVAAAGSSNVFRSFTSDSPSAPRTRHIEKRIRAFTHPGPPFGDRIGDNRSRSLSCRHTNPGRRASPTIR
jgi:hypothetical protein